MHVDLDNRIRRLNKRITDAAKYGNATNTFQELSKAIMFAARELQADDAIPKETELLKMKKVEYRNDADKPVGFSIPQIKRSKLLEKIDPYKLDEILARAEDVEGIGKETREIRVKLRKEGKQTTPKEIKKELKVRFNETVEYMQKVHVLYSEVLQDKKHFLWEETNFVFMAYVGRGKPTREGVAHVNRLYNQHTLWKDGLYDPISEGYTWEEPVYE